jgi:cytochrome c-type biogenesis protein CcmH/NrfF
MENKQGSILMQGVKDLDIFTTLLTWLVPVMIFMIVVNLIFKKIKKRK